MATGALHFYEFAANVQHTEETVYGSTGMTVTPVVSSDHRRVTYIIRFPLDCKLLTMINIRTLKQWSPVSYARYIQKFTTYPLQINLQKAISSHYGHRPQ